MNPKKFTFLFLLIALALCFSSCATVPEAPAPPAVPQSAGHTAQDPAPASPAPPSQPNAGGLTIAYLDVGQADSIVILLPNGETMLIDAGEQQHSARIIQFIQDSGRHTLDYVVATHPHADHIGGMAAVLNAFAVKNIYMPDKTHTTNTFEALLDTIAQKGLSVGVAKAGKTIFENGDVKAEFIAPNGDGYSSLNDYSAVVLLTYKNCRFLFMGDAEKQSESEILKAGYTVSADVLKVGHHGSATSSSDAFIQKVAPKYAVISCSSGNDKLPGAATLATLEKYNIDVYRTDAAGTVIATCDGETVTLAGTKTDAQPRAPTAEPPAPPAQADGNDVPANTDEPGGTVYITKTGKKYHREGCRYLTASKMAIPLEEAKKNYDACAVCGPPQ